MSPRMINGDRLWAEIMAMAALGATPGGGCRRLALTDLDGKARAFFIARCKAAGLAVSIDGMGNIFARRDGRDASLAPVMFGSHLDTVPTGGRFDGILGVLAGLEVMRTLNEAGIITEAPLELVNWTNEEGCRFPPGMLGSAVFSGNAALDFGHSRVDGDGISVRQELDRLGYLGPEPVGRPITAFIELHIEQGPELEDNATTIGIVTGSSAVRLFAVTVIGIACHIGPMPMERRRNALTGAARVIVEADRIGRASGHSRSSCNFIEASPNVNNVIPDRVRFNVDFRTEDQERAALMEADLRESAARIAAETGMEIEIVRYWSHGPVAFNSSLQSIIRSSAGARSYPLRSILTMGGHDAINLAARAPAAMVMIPCRGGLSHNKSEFASKEDCGAGANVLMDTVIAVADTPLVRRGASVELAETTRP